MHVSGNGIEVDFDGQTLTMTPANGVAAAALGGKRDVPLVLRRTDIVKVAVNAAPPNASPAEASPNPALETDQEVLQDEE